MKKPSRLFQANFSEPVLASKWPPRPHLASPWAINDLGQLCGQVSRGQSGLYGLPLNYATDATGVWKKPRVDLRTAGKNTFALLTSLISLDIQQPLLKFPPLFFHPSLTLSTAKLFLRMSLSAASTVNSTSGNPLLSSESSSEKNDDHAKSWDSLRSLDGDCGTTSEEVQFKV